jgi:hypothetical protein
MKIPKPKPVVRCTKLAPMLSRNMAITILLIQHPLPSILQAAPSSCGLGSSPTSFE